MDLNKHQYCPECGTAMQVCLPIWVTPGEESIDTSNIYWESNDSKDPGNWWCPECEDHWFPAEEDDDDQQQEHDHEQVS